jgi:hypothetical protein
MAEKDPGSSRSQDEPDIIYFHDAQVYPSTFKMRIIFAILTLGFLATIFASTIKDLLYDNFGYGEYHWPILTTKIRGERVSLDDVSNAVLEELCSYTKQKPGPERTVESIERMKLAMKSLAITDSRFRNMTVPTLFRDIKVYGEWERASRGLKIMEMCPSMLESIKTFELDVFVGFYEASPPPSAFAPKLANIISQMQDLDKLSLAIPEYQTDAFAAEFTARKLSLPNVKTVALGSFCDFAVQHCPNVETVSSNGYQFLHSERGRAWPLKIHATQLVVAASKMKHLKYFEMMDRWKPEQVEQVFETMPRIKKLGMVGGQYNGPFGEEHLKQLGRFKDLEELILVHAGDLNVGYDPPWCGNAYDGPGGEAYWQRVKQEGLEAATTVAKSVFGVNKSLQKLWVGDGMFAEAVRSNGTLDILWTYEQRDAPSGWTV